MVFPSWSRRVRNQNTKKSLWTSCCWLKGGGVHVSELQVATRSCVWPQLTASKEMETLMVQPQKMNSNPFWEWTWKLIASQSFYEIVKALTIEERLMVSRNFLGSVKMVAVIKIHPACWHCVSGAVLTTRNTKGSRIVLLSYDFAEVSTVLLWEPAFTNLSMVLNGLKIF